MQLKKNARLIGSGRLSSVYADNENIDVYIADKSGINKRSYSVFRGSVSSEGRVSFAEDFYDLGFTKAERRLLLKSVN